MANGKVQNEQPTAIVLPEPVVGASAAAHPLERISEIFAGIAEAAAVLKNIGSLDNAVAERARAIKEADSYLVDAKGAFESVQDALHKKRQEAAEFIRIADEEADKAKAENEVQAKQIIEAAVASAQSITEQAKSQAAVLVGKANAIAAEAKALREIAQAARDKLDDQIEQRKNELASVLSRIDAAQASIRNMMGVAQ